MLCDHTTALLSQKLRSEKFCLRGMMKFVLNSSLSRIQAMVPPLACATPPRTMHRESKAGSVKELRTGVDPAEPSIILKRRTSVY